MSILDKGANEFSLEELEALFKEEENPDPLPEDTDGKTPPAPAPAANDEKSKEKEATKAVAERIKQVRLEEQNVIAKKMGYTSYDEMIKSQEEKLIKDKGYDPKDLTPVVDELLKKRLENDPRIQELENIKRERVADFAKRELAEIAKLTDNEITTIEQLPKDVVEEWKKTGNLKASFLLLKGEEYITKAKVNKSVSNTKGGTEHLQNLGGGGTPPPTKTRPLTNEERQVWKQFHPTMSEEELNKKTMPI